VSVLSDNYCRYERLMWELRVKLEIEEPSENGSSATLGGLGSGSEGGGGGGRANRYWGTAVVEPPEIAGPLFEGCNDTPDLAGAVRLNAFRNRPLAQQ
jgi:hypothetical protein